jgi:hypothetical protein
VDGEGEDDGAMSDMLSFRMSWKVLRRRRRRSRWRRWIGSRAWTRSKNHSSRTRSRPMGLQRDSTSPPPPSYAPVIDELLQRLTALSLGPARVGDGGIELVADPARSGATHYRGA